MGDCRPVSSQYVHSTNSPPPWCLRREGPPALLGQKFRPSLPLGLQRYGSSHDRVDAAPAGTTRDYPRRRTAPERAPGSHRCPRCRARAGGHPAARGGLGGGRVAPTVPTPPTGALLRTPRRSGTPADNAPPHPCNPMQLRMADVRTGALHPSARTVSVWPGVTRCPRSRPACTLRYQRHAVAQTDRCACGAAVGMADARADGRTKGDPDARETESAYVPALRQRDAEGRPGHMPRSSTG